MYNTGKGIIVITTKNRRPVPYNRGAQPNEPSSCHTIKARTNLLVSCSCLSKKLQRFFCSLKFTIVQEIGTYQDTTTALQIGGVRDKGREGKGGGAEKEIK